MAVLNTTWSPLQQKQCQSFKLVHGVCLSGGGDLSKPRKRCKGTPQPSWHFNSRLVSKCHRASSSALLHFLFLSLFCIYLWPLYLLAAAQAKHGQLTKAPVPYLCVAFPLFLFHKAIDRGHWVKHLAFCMQIVSTQGLAKSGQILVMNIFLGWPGWDESNCMWYIGSVFPQWQVSLVKAA